MVAFSQSRECELPLSSHSPFSLPRLRGGLAGEEAGPCRQLPAVKQSWVLALPGNAGCAAALFALADVTMHLTFAEA